MIDYKDTAVLVTGGASGIGAALAAQLAARGADVIVADKQGDLAREVAAALPRPGFAVACDLSDPAAPARLVAEAFAWKGRLDLVCANAGFGRRKRMMQEAFGPDTMALFAVNMFAPFRMAQAYGAALETAGRRGRLMITGSENSLSLPQAVTRSRLGAYGASKHGVLIMAEWLREELAGELMDVHVLMPGGVYTPLIAQGLPDPKDIPPEFNVIMPEECARIALKGLDLGLFYIPTHKHIADDIRPRAEGVWEAIRALGLS
ncbi:MAG: SDR family NAD(P)-dependent oxidoreductase [Hyphomonas sp.]|uniref:SDR family NAD(P)-dependent oxidoreductase n=1 Tax=Hyphomonas sp. TaxID=87 RepID=UPI0035292294